MIAVAMLRLWPKLSLLDIGPHRGVNATSPAKFRDFRRLRIAASLTGQSRSPRRSWYCDGKETLAFVRFHADFLLSVARWTYDLDERSSDLKLSEFLSQPPSDLLVRGLLLGSVFATSAWL